MFLFERVVWWHNANIIPLVLFWQSNQLVAVCVFIKRALWRHYKPLFNNSLLCPLALFLSLVRFCANLLSFAQKVTMAILALYSPMISPPARRSSAFHTAEPGRRFPL